MKYGPLLLLFLVNTLNAQTDYDELTNWYFHPDKLINVIANYDLDIAVVGKDLNIDSLIEIENNANNNTGVDIFWVHPTQLSTIPTFPTSVALDDQPAATILSTILAQGGLLAKYGRFFAPRYRQASPPSFLGNGFSEEERAAALLDTYADIKAAFLHYLNNYNDGNRIILAGHSQGAFLLGMLLRDVFDSNPALRAQLVTAALGGMGFVYASPGSFAGGWWENIPLCTLVDECGCILNWRSFKEEQELPEVNTALPAFNQVLVDSGLVYRTIDLENDWFVQDSLIYSAASTSLRYYIAPDASYDLGGGANFIAFDSLFTARFKRLTSTKAVLSVDYINDPLDQRPNDLLSQEDHPNYPVWGFHVKDYHIYLWALMHQIDQKLAACSVISSVEEVSLSDVPFLVYPNPSSGTFYVKPKWPESVEEREEIYLVDMLGRVLESFILNEAETQVKLSKKGVYWLVSKRGAQKIVVQ